MFWGGLSPKKHSCRSRLLFFFAAIEQNKSPPDPYKLL